MKCEFDRNSELGLRLDFDWIQFDSIQFDSIPPLATVQAIGELTPQQQQQQQP